MFYWYFNSLVTVSAILALTSANPLGFAKAQSLKTRTDLPEMHDIAVQPLGRPESPLSPRRTTLFLHLVQLEIYRETLARGAIFSHLD